MRDDTIDAIKHQHKPGIVSNGIQLHTCHHMVTQEDESVGLWTNASMI